MEEKLRHLLKELHEELEQADRVEPEAREMLRGVMDDIHGVLNQPPGASEEAAVAVGGTSEAQDTDSPSGLKDRLDKAVVEFESSHPELSFAVERLISALTAMGI